MINSSAKALIAMSGGVDSSVAAYLIHREFEDCTAITLKLFDHAADAAARGIAYRGGDDLDDAARSAQRLGIAHRMIDRTDTFRDEVISRFVSAYLHGETPNPCVICNRHIKFAALFALAEEMGAACIATGHYARIAYAPERGRYLLKKALDPAKDQSYVLYALTQEQLSRVRFPLGEYTKAQVREIADQIGLPTAQKRDSQDICFVPDGDYAAFIERYIQKPSPEGNFVDAAGNVLGRHKGIIRYTVGQRKGLGLALPKPLYVCGKCPENNTVILGDESALYTDTVEADRINLIAMEQIDTPLRVSAKVRYSQRAAAATVTQTDDDRLRIVFDAPQRAPAKGQAVVLYDGDVVIGGGTIC